MEKLYCEDLIHFSEAMSDHNRVMIIAELMDGRSLSASWLAKHLHLSPQAIRFHLKKLQDFELIHFRCCGKHHYYEIKNPTTAAFIESTFHIIPPQESLFLGNANSKKKFKEARVCYRHLAGSLAVTLTNIFIQEKIISVMDNNFHLRQKGLKILKNYQLIPTNIDYPLLGKRCIDFSEHRDHIGGELGTVLLNFMLKQRWLTKQPNCRELTITPLGRKNLNLIIANSK